VGRALSGESMGPSSKLVATRKTEQALFQVIDAAADRLFMTSFVAYDLASVMKALTHGNEPRCESVNAARGE
jgi:hypothetical protein